MTKSLLVPMILLAASAQAGPFWHPAAKSITAAAPEVVTVCQWVRVTSVNASAGEVWLCDDLVGYGGKDPVTVDLFQTGPVKVFARWAYAVDENDALVPMLQGATEYD